MLICPIPQKHTLQKIKVLYISTIKTQRSRKFDVLCEKKSKLTPLMKYFSLPKNYYETQLMKQNSTMTKHMQREKKTIRLANIIYKILSHVTQQPICSIYTVRARN